MELVRPDIKAHTQIVQFKVAKYANLPFHLLAWGGEYIREYNCAILKDSDNNVGNKTESNRNLNTNSNLNENSNLSQNLNSNQNTNSNINSSLNSKARKLSSDRSSRRKLSSESIFGDLFNRKKRRHAKRENQDSEVPSTQTVPTTTSTSPSANTPVASSGTASTTPSDTTSTSATTSTSTSTAVPVTNATSPSDSSSVVSQTSSSASVSASSSSSSSGSSSVSGSNSDSGKATKSSSSSSSNNKIESTGRKKVDVAVKATTKVESKTNEKVIEKVTEKVREKVNIEEIYDRNSDVMAICGEGGLSKPKGAERNVTYYRPSYVHPLDENMHSTRVYSSLINFSNVTDGVNGSVIVKSENTKNNVINVKNNEKNDLKIKTKKVAIKYVYFTESDQIVKYDTMETFYALSDASNQTTFFAGRRREKNELSDAALYMEGKKCFFSVHCLKLSN